MTSLAAYEFRDPATLLTEVSERVPLLEGTAHLALVEQPSTTQRIVRIDRLTTPAEIFDYDGALDEMRGVIDTWPLPDARIPRHASLLVIARPGLCVFGPNEAQWFLADRYLNHLSSVFTGACALVTEHGWVDFMTLFAGSEPSMQRAA